MKWSHGFIFSTALGRVKLNTILALLELLVWPYEVELWFHFWYRELGLGARVKGWIVMMRVRDKKCFLFDLGKISCKQ